MRGRFSFSLLMPLGIAILVGRADAETPPLAYISSGSCIASPNGFDSKLQPVNSGVAWRTTFNAVGSTDVNGNVTEVGQSVDSASFGVGPRMHTPAANAYKDTFTSAITGPNGDHSFTLHAKVLSGAFTAGPNLGATFTMSGFNLKGWISENGLSVYGSSGSPVIQTVLLSSGSSFQRICTMSIVSTTSRQ